MRRYIANGVTYEAPSALGSVSDVLEIASIAAGVGTLDWGAGGGGGGVGSLQRIRIPKASFSGGPNPSVVIAALIGKVCFDPANPATPYDFDVFTAPGLGSVTNPTPVQNDFYSWVSGTGTLTLVGSQAEDIIIM